MAGVVGDIWRTLKRLLLPTRCLACGEVASEPVCEPCLSRCEQVGTPFCIRCGRRKQTSWISPDCAECHNVSIGVSRARSMFVYSGTGRDLLGEYKFKGRAGAGEQLVSALIGWLPDNPATLYSLPDAHPQVVVPVPLHPRRLRRRRFNQSVLIARKVAVHYGLECRPQLLERTRETQSQVGLTAAQRWVNVRGAFAVQQTQQDGLEGRSVLLVDDLMTTGATLAACARSLRKGGAAEVLGLTLFSTVQEQPPPERLQAER